MSDDHRRRAPDRAGRPPRPAGADRPHRPRDLRRRHGARGHARAAPRPRRPLQGRPGRHQGRARQRVRPGRPERPEGPPRRRRRRHPPARGRARPPSPARRSRSASRRCRPPRPPSTSPASPTAAAPPRRARRSWSAASPARPASSRRHAPARTRPGPHHRPGRDDRAGDLPALAAGRRLGARRDEPTPRALAVRLEDPEATDAFKRRALARPPGGLRFTDWHDVRDTITDQARTNTIIIGVNTLLALIAVGFTVATVISGRVLAQRREIGLLKAIGITPRGVVALLVAEYAALAVAAGLLGLVAGTAIAPALLRPMSTLLATPTPSALPARDAAGGARADRRRRRALRRDPRAQGRPPEHGRRAGARPRDPVRRRLTRGPDRRGAASPRHRPPRRQGRVHEPLARGPDGRRADDDGDHARRRALDGGDLRPRDRRSGAARQAVGPADRGRRAGRASRPEPGVERATTITGLPVTTKAARTAGPRGRRRLRPVPLRGPRRPHVRRAGRGDRRPRLLRAARREGRRHGHPDRRRPPLHGHARRPPRRARQRRRGRDLPRRDARPGSTRGRDRRPAARDRRHRARARRSAATAWTPSSSRTRSARSAPTCARSSTARARCWSPSAS